MYEAIHGNLCSRPMFHTAQVIAEVYVQEIRTSNNAASGT